MEKRQEKGLAEESVSRVIISVETSLESDKKASQQRQIELLSHAWDSTCTLA